MDQRIITIIEALHALQTKGRHTVFYNYSGHVNSIDVRIYRGEWQKKKKPVIDKMFSLDHPDLFTIPDGSTTTLEEFIAHIGGLK